MITLDFNAKVKGTTQYRNFNFNSMTMFNGRPMGASSSGLFFLDGATDNGTAIESIIEFKKSDLGIHNNKRLRFIVFGIEADGDLEITLTVDNKEARTYTVPVDTPGQQRVRIPVGRDGYGRYWSFKIKNTNGVDFSLDDIKARVVPLSSGIS